MRDSDKILNNLMVRLWSYLIELNEDLTDGTDGQRATILPIYNRLSEIVSTAYLIEGESK